MVPFPLNGPTVVPYERHERQPFLSSTKLGRHPGDPLDRGNAARSVSARYDRARRVRGARVRVVRDSDLVAFDDHGKADFMPQAGCWPRNASVRLKLLASRAPRVGGLRARAGT